MMYREGLLDDDVTLVALLGLALLIIGGFIFSYSLYGSLNGNILIVIGLAVDAGAASLHYLRRGRHAIQYQILRVLYEMHAYDGGEGAYPTVVLQKVGASTKTFEKYVDDLVRKGFVQWTPERKLVILSRGIDLLGDRNLADFLAEGDQV
jgi:predicted transcriptional regulator